MCILWHNTKSNRPISLQKQSPQLHVKFQHELIKSTFYILLLSKHQHKSINHIFLYFMERKNIRTRKDQTTQSTPVHFFHFVQFFPAGTPS